MASHCSHCTATVPDRDDTGICEPCRRAATPKPQRKRTTRTPNARTVTYERPAPDLASKADYIDTGRTALAAARAALQGNAA